MTLPTVARPFDMSLIQRGARLRRSPFFPATQAYGCRAYTVYNHMFLPSFYTDPVSEYWHLLEHVTLWDVSVERQVEISGPDAFRFTQLLTPRDLGACPVGQGRYVLLTDQHGGIVNDPVLLRLGENHFWLAIADSDVLLWARGVNAQAEMDVQIGEPDVSPLQIQGPKSTLLVGDLFGQRALGLKYYHFFATELDGIPLVVTRTGWTGEVGYEVYLRDGSRGEDLWERIMEAGRPYQIRPTGPSDIRRIEAGILNHGADMTLEDTPYHVDLGRLVDLGKDGGFIGQQALQRVHREGVRRRLVGVEIRADPLDLNQTKWPVLHQGTPVGQVTSALHSPRLEKNIGYAMVPAELAGEGTALTVDTPAGPAPATVVPMPFVDPQKQIPRAT